MKVRTKIIFGFVMVAVLCWVTVAWALMAFQTTSELTAEQLVLQESLAETNRALSSQHDWIDEITAAVNSQTKSSGSTDSAAHPVGKFISEHPSAGLDSTLSSLLSQLSVPYSAMIQEAKTVISYSDAGDYEAARNHLISTLQPKSAETIEYLGQIQDRYIALTNEQVDAIANAQNTATRACVILLIVTLVIGVVIAYVLIHSFMKPLRFLTASAIGMSRGSLEFSFDYKINDEIGKLGKSFAALATAMCEQSGALDALAQGDYTVTVPVRSDEDVINIAINNLSSHSNEVMLEVRNSSGQVSAGSQQMAIAAQELASGATEQAATIQEFTDTMQDILRSSEESASEAQTALADVSEAGRLMDISMKAMQDMLGAMQEIDSNSRNITNIIGVIDNIASQTNLLALNASVEAARAGQNGRGFAVVADEVGNLAKRSLAAAKETASLIGASTQSVERGNKLAHSVNETLKSVADIAVENARSIQHMSGLSVRQAEAVTAATNGITQLSNVVQANSASAQQTAASSQEMSAQAVYLDDIVARFSLRESIAASHARGIPERAAPALRQIAQPSMGKY